MPSKWWTDAIPFSVTRINTTLPGPSSQLRQGSEIINPAEEVVPSRTSTLQHNGLVAIFTKLVTQLIQKRFALRVVNVEHQHVRLGGYAEGFISIYCVFDCRPTCILVVTTNL